VVDAYREPPPPTREEFTALEDRIAAVEKRRPWTKVIVLAFVPGVVVALAYDHEWGGPALRGVGIAIAAVCSGAAVMWLIETEGKPG